MTFILSGRGFTTATTRSRSKALPLSLPTSHAALTSRPVAELLRYKLPTLISPMAVFDKNDPARPEVERFISQVFRRQHDAILTAFMPLLLANADTTEAISCAVGLRPVDDQPLFLERYLKRPVDAMLADTHQVAVARDRMVEVGNLAATRAGACRCLFALLIHYLAAHRVEWAVCTGTATVRAALKKSGIAYTLINRARAEALGDDRFNWGTYYHNNPIVLAIHIPSSLKTLDPNYRLVLEQTP